jgi:fructokinase
MDPAPVGIGIPGSESPKTGLIRNANSTWLNGRPLRQDLEAALARPVRLANDANCFALSEARDGAGAGAQVVFGVILGTGCGGGVVVDGRLLEGASRVAGEWGHASLPWPRYQEAREAPACWCGKRGCLETWISGPAFARWASEALGEILSAEAIAARAAAGDVEAEACLDRLFDRIARGLAMVANVIDPDVVVLGGGLSNIKGIAESVEAKLKAYAFGDVMATRVVGNRFGDSSGVRGAAWLWAEPGP